MTASGLKYIVLLIAEQEREEADLPDVSDVDAEDEELVFMSILFDQGELGVAIYNALTTSLKTLQLPIADQQELEEILERLHTQFEVNYVLVSSRNASSNGMLRMVKKIDEKLQTKTRISVRKISATQKAAKQLSMSRSGTLLQSSGNLKHARSFFDFKSTQQIRATGALLLYLSTEKVSGVVWDVSCNHSTNIAQTGNQLDDVESVFFSSVEQVALDGFMYIDKTTLQSLQIFNHVGRLEISLSVCTHLSLCLAGSTSFTCQGKVMHSLLAFLSTQLMLFYRDLVEQKKALGAVMFYLNYNSFFGKSANDTFPRSLFGLLNRTVTKSGGSMLRRWMLTPLVSCVQIDERHNSVAFFVDAENDELRQLLVLLFT
ncbi:hypothetical protein DD238_004570 [Peronospora effusa]|uniref:DNA mismatch repair protein MutS core domain-containing protein n=1 Tax=Peronospora effusa TaxID=542832 RepID=A0A3M6VCD5_9STRA|nr:hypothetical protein DD238_004570 [Peronospora effusa]RQM15268.1 hypothetical protein DD237_002983 [Peronospora effusa]